MTEHVTMHRMGCWAAFLASAVVALSGCGRGEALEPLEGRWVGTFGDEFQFMRAEFASTWRGQVGSLYLQGAGDLTLVKSGRSGDEIVLEMKYGDERVIFSPHATRDAMTGNLNWPTGRARLQLHRVVSVDRQRLQAYLGTYRMGSEVRTIKDCATELGWDQLIYVNPKNGARKALFPISETTFFFGPGFIIPDPIEGRVTFLIGTDGRVQSLLWEQAGSSAAIAERVEPRQEQQLEPVARPEGASSCRPFPGSNPLRASLRRER